MTPHQLTVLLVIAVICALIVYRGEKSGWNLIAWVPALAVAVVMGVSFLTIAIAWALQLPISQILILLFFTSGAAYVPWLIGSKTANYVPWLIGRKTAKFPGPQ